MHRERRSCLYGIPGCIAVNIRGGIIGCPGGVCRTVSPVSILDISVSISRNICGSVINCCPGGCVAVNIRGRIIGCSDCIADNISGIIINCCSDCSGGVCRIGISGCVA